VFAIEAVYRHLKYGQYIHQRFINELSDVVDDLMDEK
jgi:hypothetical protein